MLTAIAVAFVFGQVSNPAKKPMLPKGFVRPDVKDDAPDWAKEFFMRNELWRLEQIDKAKATIAKPPKNLDASARARTIQNLRSRITKLTTSSFVVDDFRESTFTFDAIGTFYCSGKVRHVIDDSHAVFQLTIPPDVVTSKNNAVKLDAVFKGSTAKLVDDRLVVFEGVFRVSGKRKIAGSTMLVFQQVNLNRYLNNSN